jgi:mono/diheme cytochrome c family protein
MRKIAIIVIIIMVVLTLLPIAALSFVVFTKPNVGESPSLTVASSPAVIERGRYLFHHQAACVSCHTPRNAELFSGPVLTDKIGIGGERFSYSMGVPGAIFASNLTPAALKDWSDGDIYRALTRGVNKQGVALFPLMPYKHYGAMAESDIHALIAYMRTIPAQDSVIPERRLTFPMNIIVRVIPKETVQPAQPPAQIAPDYGAYVANAAACLHCHTKSNHGKVKPGSEMSGGVEFPQPDGSIVRSSNITFDKETGIGTWSKEQFIKRFRDSVELAKNPVKAGQPNTPMPWTDYAGMNDVDLGALYDYLKSLPIAVNKVEPFTPVKQ